MNDFEDRIRDGLGSGPDDVPSLPPFADVERRARRTTRRRRALAGGAVLGTLAIVAGVLAMQQPDDDSHTVVVTQPESTTSTTEATTSTSSTTTSTTVQTTTTGWVGPPVERPSRVIVATEHGRLLVLEVPSGEVVTDLGPVVPGASADTILVTDIDVTPLGGTVYVSTCCDPSGGRLLAGPVDGSAGLSTIAAARTVRVGVATRAWLALEVPTGLVVSTTPEGLDSARIDVPDEIGLGLRGLTWSVDGRYLAWVQGSTLTVAEVVTEDDVRVVATHESPSGQYWSDPAFRSDGRILVLRGPVGVQEAGPLEHIDVIDPTSGDTLDSIPLTPAGSNLRYDDSGTWLLAVASDRLVLLGPDGEVTTIAIRVMAADWMPD